VDPGEGKKHEDVLFAYCCKGDKMKEVEMGGTCSTHVGDEKRTQRKGKRPHGGRVHIWERNVKMDLR
jgi:hypothetical protein